MLWQLLIQIRNVASEPEEEDECGLYLAPSAIPGGTGLGMYSGSQSYLKGERFADADLLILLHKIEWHNGHQPHEFLWNDYVWGSSMFPGTEYDVDDIETTAMVSSGFGAAINCMIPLINVEDENRDDWSSYEMTLSGVSSQSPGAGAFTPYFGRRFMAIRDIAPYSELYTDYGEDYFNSRRGYDFMPFLRDYKVADQLLESLLRHMERLRGGGDEGNKSRRPWVQERKHSKRRSPLIGNAQFQQDLFRTISTPLRLWNRKTFHALPDPDSATLDDIQQLLNFGGTKYKTYNATVRSHEWMRENGQCMDHIMDGISNIPDAGRGGFARRFIPKDGLVAPAPLIHLPDRSVLTLYGSYENMDQGQVYRNASDPVGHQLLLNYCWGHRDSTLLLCPYGLLNFHINHDSRNPNTKIVWPEKCRLRHPEWFEMPIEAWGRTGHSGLSMDYVALRNIQPGEEITVDYGHEWERAWQGHAKRFDPPRRYYTPAFELNKRVDLTIPTVYEEHDVQFVDVLTSCRGHFLPNDYKVQSFKFGFQDEDEYDDFFLCRALRRQDTNTTTTEDDRYIVEVFTSAPFYQQESDEEETIHDDPALVLFDLPRDAFFFIDIPYKRDHHQEWAFRHDMRIPDELFPDVWKNYDQNDDEQ